MDTYPTTQPHTYANRGSDDSLVEGTAENGEYMEIQDTCLDGQGHFISGRVSKKNSVVSGKRPSGPYEEISDLKMDPPKVGTYEEIPDIMTNLPRIQDDVTDEYLEEGKPNTVKSDNIVIEEPSNMNSLYENDDKTSTIVNAEDETVLLDNDVYEDGEHILVAKNEIREEKPGIVKAADETEIMDIDLYEGGDDMARVENGAHEDKLDNIGKGTDETELMDNDLYEGGERMIATENGAYKELWGGVSIRTICKSNTARDPFHKGLWHHFLNLYPNLQTIHLWGVEWSPHVSGIVWWSTSMAFFWCRKV